LHLIYNTLLWLLYSCTIFLLPITFLCGVIKDSNYSAISVMYTLNVFLLQEIRTILVSFVNVSHIYFLNMNALHFVLVRNRLWSCYANLTGVCIWFHCTTKFLCYYLPNFTS
jgi:hypothetical protein